VTQSNPLNMSRFSRIRNLSVVPRKAPAESGTPESGAPNQPSWVGTPQKGAPERGIPVIAIPEKGATAPDPPVLGTVATPALREKGTPEKGVPCRSEQEDISTAISEKGTPESDTAVGGIPRWGVPLSQVGQRIAALNIRKAVLVQDGHSLGEQALYQVLWDHAKSYDKDSRIISIGYRQLSHLGRMTVNNCKANILSLIQKLAIEEAVAHSHAQARTYRVFSYPTILERRKNAGLTHFVKSRGVAFVAPDTGEPLTARLRTRGTPAKSTPPFALAERGTPEQGPLGISVSGTRAVPLSSTPSYRQSFRQFPRQSTTTDLDVVRKVLQTTLPTFDDTAVEQLWAECRQQVPDITPGELLRLFEDKLPLSQARGIENPIGFLVRAVARSCTPAAIAALRQGREESPAVELSFDQGELQDLLQDPSTPPQMRALIKAKLGKRV
jgi:hypothetical protein